MFDWLALYSIYRFCSHLKILENILEFCSIQMLFWRIAKRSFCNPPSILNWWCIQHDIKLELANVTPTIVKVIAKFSIELFLV